MRLATGLLTPTEGRVGVTDDAPKDLASLVADMDGDAQLAVREVTGGGYPHSENSITPKRAGCRRSL